MVVVAATRRSAARRWSPVEIANGSTIDVRGANHAQVIAIAERFVKRVADTRGLQLRVSEKPDANAAIAFEVDPHADVVGDAGYRIVVDHPA